MPIETHSQPSSLVKGARSINHAAHYGSQSGTDLRRRDPFRQLSAATDLCQKMECSEAVAKRSADGWERSIRAYEALLNVRVALRTKQNLRPERFPCFGGLRDGIEDAQQHGMNHKTVVVIPMKRRPISVDSIPLVPGIHGADCIVYTHRIPPCAHERQCGFNHCRKQQPIVVAGANLAGRLEGGDHMALGL